MQAETERKDESGFKLRLIQLGLISEIRDPARNRAAFLGYKPVTIRGKPLSETIVEDRR